MKTLHKLTLLSPDSTEGLKKIDLKQGDWSVKSYTLRGGLQEGVDVVEINNGRLSFAVLPTRGMGIWKGECGDVSLGWNSPVKTPVHPSFINYQDRGGIGWLKGFNEWIVRCGLNNMGAPGTDRDGTALTLHGKIANIPAHSVSLEISDEAIILRGEIDETMMLGPALRLNTEIRTEPGSGKLTISDTVTNIGAAPAEHELLYHINYGESLLEKGSKALAPFKHVAPRDLRAAEGIDSFNVYEDPETGYAEQVYFYQLVEKSGSGGTMVMLKNASGDRASVLRYSLSDFPCFTLWKNTAGKADGYVTGLEPGTNYPNCRPVEREQGRLLSLAGGESRRTALSIEVLESKEAVEDAENEINRLQEQVEGKVHRQPLALFSGN
ncbi:aldose 1-epimerase family protein [Spirochaeta isovalerica]|uniref:DUF4432 domain-containing protein n=1 Tax=Spirochaeta isovalerica TaxID=150 RepID=A0A841RBU0_9SPIO|nr:aldose 1-epimerase family protein [Spirochaeta isovalerica]MBB6479872.1 hypothetical protein [Spirochaeta isovalerica]